MENHPRRRARIDGIEGIIVASETPEARASETAGGRCSSSPSKPLSVQQQRSTMDGPEKRGGERQKGRR